MHAKTKLKMIKISVFSCFTNVVKDNGILELVAWLDTQILTKGYSLLFQWVVIPKGRYSEGSLFRRFEYSEGSLLRRSVIPKVR